MPGSRFGRSQRPAQVSISAIARLTGRDRKTVRAAITAPLTTPRRRAGQVARCTKLDPYRPYLEQSLADGVRNARKHFEELRA